MKKSYSIKMTEGSSLKNIILFALPLIATNLLQFLYTAADTVIVGLSSEADAVGAIGTTTPLINLIINIFIGCAVGAKVSTAVTLGEKNKKRQKKQYIHQF